MKKAHLLSGLLILIILLPLVITSFAWINNSDCEIVIATEEEDQNESSKSDEDDNEDNEVVWETILYGQRYYLYLSSSNSFRFLHNANFKSNCTDVLTPPPEFIV